MPSNSPANAALPLSRVEDEALFVHAKAWAPAEFHVLEAVDPVAAIVEYARRNQIDQSSWARAAAAAFRATSAASRRASSPSRTAR